VKIPLLNDFRESFNDPVWHGIAASICHKHHVEFGELQRAQGTENVVFFIDDTFIVKIYTPLRNGYAREKGGLEFAAGKSSITFPTIHAGGNFEGFDYLIMTRISGRMITRAEWLKTESSVQVQLIHELARGLSELHTPEPGDINFHWGEFIRMQLDSVMDRQRESGATQQWLEALPAYLEKNLDLIPKDPRIVFMHGDVHFGNLAVVDESGGLKIAGMFDLSDSLTGFHEYEFVAPGVLMIQGQGELQREFFRAYGYPDQEINEELRTRLMLLTILYECSSLRRYATRLGPGAEKLTLNELERAIWNFVK
jgi:hygromycin-B 7''-O-kinase